MNESIPIGLIAGGGNFPILIAQAAQKEGKKVVVVAHEGETRPELDLFGGKDFLDPSGRIWEADPDF